MNLQRKTNTKGFTLVELIVVITILAILGTIAFVSFGGQSAAARDSKRKSDLGNLNTKIGVLNAGGTSITAFASGTTANALTTPSIGGAPSSTTDYVAGDLSYTALGAKQPDFQDPSISTSYKIGTTSRAGGSYELVATLENDNNGNPFPNALIIGTFKSRSTTTYVATGSTTGSGGSIAIASNAIGVFKINDTVNITGIAGTGLSGAKITGVSTDGSTITLSSATSITNTTSGGTIALAAGETAGLVASAASTPARFTGVISGMVYSTGITNGSQNVAY